jgi:hypothetical protein
MQECSRGIRNHGIERHCISVLRPLVCSIYCYFTEDHLLHRVLCHPFHDCPLLTFNLNICSAACFLFAGDIIQSLPEVSLLLALDNGADVVKCLLVFFFACNPFPFLQLLPSEPFPVFLIEKAFLLTCL